MSGNGNGVTKERIGVFVCECGTNIAGMVNVQAVADFAATIDGVVVAKIHKYMCSDPGQEMIKNEIIEHNLTRVVVASCSPLMHEPTFRGAVNQADMNPFLYQHANIREHVSWVTEDVLDATEKTKRLIHAAVRRVMLHAPLNVKQVPVKPGVVVIGGGIAGIEAALTCANAGQQVYLVEKEPSIGGHMAQFDKTFPTLDCAACILTPKMVQVARHPNIELLSQSELVELNGFVGNFVAKVKSRPRYVTDACTACDDCTPECPVSVPAGFEEGLITRKAIFRPFAQAVPSVFTIDKQERPPCVINCPINQDAAGYIALVGQGKYEQAMNLIRRRNPLPTFLGWACYHPCETECNRGDVEEPLAIRQIKRFVVEKAIEGGYGFDPPEMPEKRSEKVAIVGAGPSGLACAHDLALEGYNVTVFDELPEPGGMLFVGIPRFRMPRDLMRKDIEYIRKMGVEFRTGVSVGRDVTIDQLRKDHQAVYIATGAHRGVKMDIPGEDLEGVEQGIEYLRRVSLDQPVPEGKTVAVIGGGNTAMDVARTAWRMGADKVHILYRRTEAEMPADPEEYEAAQEEGIVFDYLKAPVAFEGENGRLRKMRVIKMELGLPDESGRRRPIPVEGSEHYIPVDLVLLAVSQQPDLTCLPEGGSGFEITRWNTITANPESQTTSVEGVFAGGDVTTGPSTIVESVAAGQRAALYIQKHIQGEPIDDLMKVRLDLANKRKEETATANWERFTKGVERKPRAKMRTISVDQRLGNFDMVELGFSEEEARSEAERCLHCGVCVECYECVRVCQAKAVDHDQKETIREIEAGAVLVTTGMKTFDPSVLPQYGYGVLPDVITSLEFERISNASGPTGGEIIKADGTKPKSVAILHCIGSRDSNTNEYCSRVCCMYSMKIAHLVREKLDAEVFEFYIDIRAAGKGYEEFYQRNLEEGVTFIRGKGAEVSDVPQTPEEEGRLIVSSEDTLLGMVRRVPVDMVILAVGLEPASDVQKLAQTLRISRSPDGFFLERHPKLAPVATASDGIYVAGACQGPKDIPDSVAQGNAATGQALAMIDKGYVEVEPTVAHVNGDLCSACRTCISMCPYQAIAYSEEEKHAVVEEALCKGCGTCVAACPSAAISQFGFTDDQIFAEIEGAMMLASAGGVLAFER